MAFQLRGTFGRLLDWQLCSEEWSFPIADGVGAIKVQQYGLRDGDCIDPNQLVFPMDHHVDIEIRHDGFVAKPHGAKPWWLGAAKMLFQGRAEVRNGDINIVGTYGVPNCVRAFQALWSGFVLLISVLSFPITIIATFSVGLIEGQALGGIVGFGFGLLSATLFAAFGVAMLILVKAIWFVTRAANSSGRPSLRAFLPNISVQDRGEERMT